MTVPTPRLLLRRLAVYARLALLAIVILGTKPGHCRVDSTFPQAEAETTVPLAEAAEILVDPSGKLSFEDVTSPALDRFFVPAKRHLFQGYARGTFWIRFTLLTPEHGSARGQFLHVSPTWLDEVRLYATGSGSDLAPPMTSGDQHPFNARAVRSGSIFFPVSLPGQYYLQVRTHGPASIGLSLMSRSSVDWHETRKLIIFSTMSGAILVMVLMNAVFWIWVRESTYALYSLFLASVWAVTFFLNGYGAAVLPELPALADRLTDASVCLFIGTGYLFVSKFFQYSSHSRWMSRLAQLSTFSFLGAAVFALLGQYARIIEWVYLMAMSLALINACFLAFLILKRSQSRFVWPALLFFLVSATWATYGAMLANYVEVSHPELLDGLIPAASFATLALLNINIAGWSRKAARKLREEQSKTMFSLLAAKSAIDATARQREFVSLVSHEFRTPLAIIEAVSHALKVSPSGKDTRTRESVGKIQKAVRRLSLLIENLLVDDSLESRSNSPTALLDLRELLVNLKDATLAEDESRIVLDAPNLPVRILANRGHVETVVRNVVQNALKYSGQDTRVRIELTATDFLASIDVWNLGDPISEGDAEKIFHKFYRGGETRAPGTGLGLHISRALARQHAGDVRLLRSGQDGTVFSISFPLALP